MVVKESDTSVASSRKNDEDVSIVSTKDDIKTRKYSIIEASPKGKVLYRLIKEKKWDEIKLDEYEAELKEWIEEKNDDKSSRWKSLLIHLVSFSLRLDSNCLTGTDSQLTSTLSLRNRN